MEYSCTQDNTTRPSSSQAKTRRVWTRAEEGALIDALKDMVTEGWRADNGFRQGYNFEIERRLKAKFPGCDIRADPHISSKIHVWRKTYVSVALIKSNSSFGWSEVTKSFSCDDKVWTAWLKVDPHAKSLRNKSFPYINEWAEIFGKDRATGENAQGFEDAANDVPQQDMQNTPDSENEEVPSYQNQNDGNPGLAMGDTSGTASDLSGIASRLGFEHDEEQKRNAVFDSLSNMHFLLVEEKMVVTMRLCKNPQELSMFFSLTSDMKAVMVKMMREGRMDNMDIDANGPHFFKPVTFTTLHTTAFPRATHHHYRGVELPHTCRIQTIEGRSYETTLKMVNNCPTLVDGWRDFILEEDITLCYFLVFRPRSIFDFEVWLLQPNGCERQPQYTFTIEIKPTHVERARLAIPMQFWRDYIEGMYSNYNSAILKFGDYSYDVEIIHGHGKKLIQNGRARQFFDDNNIVVGDVCTFFLLPSDEGLKFKVKL
ncbi:transcriptional factor B3 family protein [Striga asiatica]|uniref:Transcriptional factor B3 family protein n=1 Tax=Striga asiatica TaxID=4170 RepID=A0A5A7QGQ2_STRAF|nr:transcriptional factor B3 family protein [Striga asiatica]